MSGLPDLRDFVRGEPLPREATILVSGGPDTVAKLTAHAERVRRAFVLDGAPVLGISVLAALDDIGPASLDGILSGKLPPTASSISSRPASSPMPGSICYRRSADHI
ncbi:MAG TPA: hypothetical protein VFB84_08025 [Micromonosporaceae bacterium]|nr:hypothetical protein [Micromonosporaceae bacterium]